jgi:tetratricopeptide (TPR) repeat protein
MTLRKQCIAWVLYVVAVSSVHAQQQPAALREQLQQYVTQLQANPSDDALRTKIIQLALTLDPKPANPPDLPETIGAATYAFKNAQSDTDIVNAANLYAKAALEAPWRADLYFNEAIALEKAKRLDEAIITYRFYLLAAPDATDADAVKQKIGGLKYELSQQQEQARQAEAEREAAAQAAREAEAAQHRTQEERDTYTDVSTGLMWTRQQTERMFYWNDAVSYCRNLALDGHSDWRLPTIDELAAICDQSVNGQEQCVKSGMFASRSWSSTTNGSGVWWFNFLSGSRYFTKGAVRSGYMNVLCVRRAGG